MTKTIITSTMYNKIRVDFIDTKDMRRPWTVRVLQIYANDSPYDVIDRYDFESISKAALRYETLCREYNVKTPAERM